MLHHQVFQSKQKIVADVAYNGQSGNSSESAGEFQLEVGILESSAYGSVFTVTARGIELDEESVRDLARQVMTRNDDRPRGKLALVVPSNNSGFGGVFTQEAPAGLDVRFFTSDLQAKRWITALAPVEVFGRLTRPRPTLNWASLARGGALVAGGLIATLAVNTLLDTTIERQRPAVAQAYEPPTSPPQHARPAKLATARSATNSVLARLGHFANGAAEIAPAEIDQ